MMSRTAPERTPIKTVFHRYGEILILLLLILVVTLTQTATAQPPASTSVVNHVPLTAEQVVQQLVRMNLERGRALRAYRGTRTYRVEYHGFLGVRSASMVVGVNYLSPETKEFAVQSATGSTVIVDKVLKKLLQAEKEAMNEDIQRRSALTEDNYRFTLIAYESGPAGATYVLQVEPRTKDKFLYRGRIWVDAEDFAVVRLEAAPAKNPSFWTKKAEIVQVYQKVSDFWLPVYNHSVTGVRLGGRAELTIDYKDYEITAADRVSGSSAHPSSSRVDIARTQE